MIFFAAKGGEVLYSQQEEDRELTVAQIMNSLLPNSDEIEESRKNHLIIQVWPKSNPLWLYSGGDQYIQGIRPGSLSVWRTMDGGL